MPVNTVKKSRKQRRRRVGGKKAEQRPQAVRKESANKVPSETRLRQRLRQQEVMLEQIRQENRQLRQQWAKKAGAVSGENGMLQKQIVTLSAELKQLQVVQKSAQEEQARLKSLLAEMPIATADELKKPVARQDYAAGVMTGRDLLVMQEGQGLLGLKTDNRLLLAGLRDALNQQVKLNSTALQEALSAAEVRTRQARERIVIAQKAVGEKYLAAFRKGKGTEKDDSGFWYRLEYAGDGEPIRGGGYPGGSGGERKTNGRQCGGGYGCVGTQSGDEAGGITLRCSAGHLNG